MWVWLILVVLAIASILFISRELKIHERKTRELKEKLEQKERESQQVGTYLFEGQYHIGDLLSVVCEHDLSPKGLEGTRALVSWLLGREVRIDNLDAECDLARPILLKKMPWLDKIVYTKEIIESNPDKFVRDQADLYGAYHQVN